MLFYIPSVSGAAKMKTIYKYTLQRIDEQQIMIPEGSVILSVMMQNQQICVWAEVDTDYPEIPCTFWVVGTGNPMPIDCDQNGDYLGSVIDSQFVWHIFSNGI